MAGIIVLFGGFPVFDDELRTAARDFGWQIRNAMDSDGLHRLGKEEDVVAVAFYHPVTDWREALAQTRMCTPQAKLVVCHRFANLPWPTMAEEGIFYPIAVPFRYSEVRQSMGFISAALKQERVPDLVEGW